MEERQNLNFEFRDSEARSEDLDGRVLPDSPLPANTGSALSSIARAVTIRGGNTVVSKSRSRNHSSIHLGGSQDKVRGQSMTSALHTLLASFTTAAAAKAFLTDSLEMLDQWLQASAQRSITFEHQRNTVGLKGRDDLEKLISVLQRM